MKESKFNLYFNAPDGARIAFNSLSCGLAVVDENYERLLAAISTDVIPKDLVEVCEAAKRGNFIVESDKDEVLDYETKRTAQKFSTQSFGLTLAPTLDCNFKCVYCYETRRKGKMSTETQSNIVTLVERRAPEIKNFVSCRFQNRKICRKQNRNGRGLFSAGFGACPFLSGICNRGFCNSKSTEADAFEGDPAPIGSADRP